MSTLFPGMSLQNGKYRIEEVLGQGGFGITYLATQTLINRSVAVKEFFFRDCCEREAMSNLVTVPTAANKELVERFEKKFLKEARIILNLNHPNIIRVLDVFQENGTSYYVMEYIVGQSLQDRLNTDSKLTIEESLQITFTVGNALSYIHSKHIAHLDIKPGNIMLDSSTKRVLLIDFGVSKQYDPISGDGTTTTPAGISQGYSPLEQYTPGGVNVFSPQSDIYSLGATLYKMLTGTTPPSAIDISQQGLAIPNYVPRHIGYALQAAMQPVLRNRPATVVDFLKLLNGGNAFPYDKERTIVNNPALQNSTLQNPTRQTPTRPSTGNNKWLLPTAVGLAILAIIIGFLILFNSKSKSSIDKEEQTSTNIKSDTSETGTTDEEEEEETEEIHYTWYEKEEPSAYDQLKTKIRYPYPEGGNSELIQSLREWINEKLGGKFEGDLSDGDAMFEYYSSHLSDDKETQYDISIKPIYEDDKVITFVTTKSMFAGGMHGSDDEHGATFRKSDGTIFNSDMITTTTDFQPYIIEGLKKSLEVTTDEELKDNLFLFDSPTYNIDNLPLPQAGPWITENGLTYRYSEYEICAYAYGQPTFVVPRNVVIENLTATGKTFF